MKSGMKMSLFAFPDSFMEIRTFYHDETINFREPNEVFWGDTMRVWFRTGRYQADGVFLVLDGEELEMSWDHDHNDFDYYTTRINVSQNTVSYCFRISVEGKEIYYGRNGVCDNEDEIIPFHVIPGFNTPEWQKGAVMYQIFPDRFANGDPSNDVKDGEYIYMDRPVKHFDWDDSENAVHVWDFCGGDLQGVIDRLDYLHDLGIEVIYFNPLFTSPSNHRYDITDYDNIDPHLGDNDLFASLVQEAHSRDIKIIIDGVFNHCGSDNVWMNRKCDPRITDGAYGERDSRYHDYFKFTDYFCTEYECWWDVPTLPKLNYEGSEDLEKDILRIARKWMSAPYNADGWRLDVAADLGHSPEYNHRFWKMFRKAVKSCGENKFIIAEHYGDPSSWLKGDEWDSIMNYDGFMDPVSFFFTGVDKHSDMSNHFLMGNAEAFAASLNDGILAFNADSYLCAMNQLDNHDHSRFLTRTNGRIGRVKDLGPEAAQTDIRTYVLRAAATFMMFWPGAPCIYYGDEAGLCGFTDPDNRRTFPKSPYDQSVFEFFCSVIALRRKCRIVRNGSVKIIYAARGVLAFSRFDRQNSLFCVVSASDADTDVEIPIWVAGRAGYMENETMSILMQSDRHGFTFEKTDVTAHRGILKVTVPAGGALVIE